MECEDPFAMAGKEEGAITVEKLGLTGVLNDEGEDEGLLGGGGDSDEEGVAGAGTARSSRSSYGEYPWLPPCETLEEVSATSRIWVTSYRIGVQNSTSRLPKGMIC